MTLNTTATPGNKQDFLLEESKKLLLAPFRALAKFTATAGIFALAFEVQYLNTHALQIYVARLTAIVIAFVLLTLSYTKAGKKNPVFLVHFLLVTIIASFGSIIFLIPATFTVNSHILSLIIFTAALFLSWDVKNQIIVAIYYNIVFAASVLLTDKSILLLPNVFESVLLVLFISVMAVVASAVNYRLRKDAINKSYEVSVSEKKFRNIFENSAEGIFQTNLEGKFLTANLSLAKMLAVNSEEDVLNLNLFKNVFKRPGDVELLNKLFEKQSKIKNFRALLRRTDNIDLFAKMNIRIGFDDDNKPVLYEGSIIDITQQVLAEAERQKALDALRDEKTKIEISAQRARQESQYKTKFLAGMSHEIRTPMNSIMGFLTLVENDLFDDREEMKSFAKDVRTASDTLLQIINNILDISKIEAGKMELNEVEFKVHEEVEKGIAIIKQAIKSKGLSLSSEIDADIPEVLIGDATRFRQIILNLLTNAHKYTDKGGITITLKALSKNAETVQVQVSVKDTGPGIPQEKMSKLFEAYSQLDAAQSTKGTGLGLVICKEFVQLMGGRIDVDSKEGEGTDFYFTVPFKIAEADRQVAPPPKQPVEENIVPEHKVGAQAEKVAEELKVELKEEVPAEAEEIEEEIVKSDKKTLLLVEDNPISQSLELKILKEVGYNVEAVSNGTDAIDSIKTGRFNLVLMDIEMDDMDGITATKIIRNLPGKAANIPIIAVTAHSSMKDREMCLNGGMDDYIAKPINIHFLKITIDQWLNAER